MLDLAFVGGGLSAALTAYRLAQCRPEVRVGVFEAGPHLGGNHTWSFHATDVPPSTLEWLRPLVSKSWDGHDVAFRSYEKRLAGEYLSIESTRLAEVIEAKLGEAVTLNTKADPKTIDAKIVIDARGFSAAPTWPCGFQKFLGVELELAADHGLSVPMIMDTRVEQHGAFRFVYCLPWSERRMLIEDTYYADDERIDLPVLRERVKAYAAGRGWKIERVLREEAAALPIPLSGAAPLPTEPTIGVAAGFFHATTGYSLPLAATLADAIAAEPSWTKASLQKFLHARARRHWSGQTFFRLLNRMLFRGAEPQERVRIFEAFYRHDEALIGRFYAGQLTTGDIFKVLARGAPTVPGPRAVRAALW